MLFLFTFTNGYGLVLSHTNTHKKTFTKFTHTHSLSSQLFARVCVWYFHFGDLRVPNSYGCVVVASRYCLALEQVTCFAKQRRTRFRAEHHKLSITIMRGWSTFGQTSGANFTTVLIQVQKQNKNQINHKHVSIHVSIQSTCTNTWQNTLLFFLILLIADIFFF